MVAWSSRSVSKGSRSKFSISIPPQPPPTTSELGFRTGRGRGNPKVTASREREESASGFLIVLRTCIHGNTTYRPPHLHPLLAPHDSSPRRRISPSSLPFSLPPPLYPWVHRVAIRLFRSGLGSLVPIRALHSVIMCFWRFWLLPLAHPVSWCLLSAL